MGERGEQGKHNKKLAPQYEKVASVLNSHILVVNKNTPIDFKLLKKCSDLFWLNRDFFWDKNLTVLLDSFGGSEPNAFALTEVLKDFSLIIKLLLLRTPEVLPLCFASAHRKCSTGKNLFLAVLGLQFPTITVLERIFQKALFVKD